MPKISVITPKRFIQVIARLGFFRYSKGKGSHLVMAHRDGRKVVVPIHSGDIPAGTLLAMLRDIELTKEEFSGHLRKEKGK